MLNSRSLAGKFFLIQIAVVALLVVAAVLALVLQAQRDSTKEAENRSRGVAETFANSPGVLRALESEDPTAALQPRTEAARKGAQVAFIVVFDVGGVRYTSPQPELIGKHVIGEIRPFFSGKTITWVGDTTEGESVITTAPITRPDGSIAAFVSAGITKERVNNSVQEQLPVLLGGAAAALAVSMAGSWLVGWRLRRQTHGLGPAEMTRMYEHHDAVLHSVREGVLIISGDGRLLLANDEARRLLDLPVDAEHRGIGELGLEAGMARLLESEGAATDEVHMAGERLLAANKRLTDRAGGPPGSVVTLRDTTELQALTGRAEVARERLRLLYDAGVRIGTTLDVVRTAQELAEVAIPQFADFVTVELLAPVQRGDEPAGTAGMRRTVVRGIREDAPFIPEGELITWLPDTPMASGLRTGHAVLVPELAAAEGWRAQHPGRARQLLDYGVHTLISVPMQARGVVLGMANFWRSERAEPFDEEDLSFAEELVARAAVCIDNARRFTREHAMAVTLQRSLLPRGVPEQDALDVAFRYLPAQAGVGGDWFDVIPLSGARVALVVGDVVGHGLHAAATMGRLRTAVQNFSTLDLPPDELLGHLDELVTRIDQDEATEGDGRGVTGATCLYAIYDPVNGRATVARAGHLGPAVVTPDGTVEFPEVPASPPLGLGGHPFETAELNLAEGSRLVLYTDGLVEDRSRDIDIGLGMLGRTLDEHGTEEPEDLCRAVIETMLPLRPSDDVALLVARTRLIDPDRVAEWAVSSDPAAVAPIRAGVTRRLREWGLEEVGFTTELILSELVTNAILYGSQPVRVRLLYERSLICEVADGSSTSPHLRQARTTDEGGRGLFLVAHMAQRWGTRYTPHGKIIWTEQPVHDGPMGGSPDLGDLLLNDGGTSQR